MTNAKKELLAQKIMASANENGEFIKAFAAVEDATSMEKFLNENGFEVSLEEVEALFAEGLQEILKFKDSATEEELSEEELSDVAGGGFFSGTLRLVASSGAAFGFGALCAVCPAASAASPYVVGGLTAWTTAGYMK